MIRFLTIIFAIMVLILPAMANTDNAYHLELLEKSDDFIDNNDFHGAIACLKEALPLIPSDSIISLSSAYNSLSYSYFRLGDYIKATDIGKKALEFDQQIGDSANISKSLALLAAIFTHQRLFGDAEHYMRDAIEMVPHNNSNMLAARYATLGEILAVQQKCDEAYDYILKAYVLDTTAHRASKAAIRLSQLGSTLVYMKNYSKAADVLAQASTELKAAGNISSLCINMIAQIKTYTSLNRRLDAERIAEECIRLSDNINQRKTKLDALKLLASLRKSPELYQQAMNLNDSLYNEQIQNQIAEFEVQYAKAEADKAAAEERIRHAAEKQKMRIIILSLIGGLFLISLLVFYIFRVLSIKKKANAELLEKNAILSEQKEEIRAQRDEIEEQRDEIMAQRDHIEAQSKEIQASINYARRIQRSMLTPAETISSIFPDYFLLYMPRNVVSGDYYWVGQFGDNKVCIVADCTGHGVPGGFLSVLGMSNLNYIVGQDVSPDTILNRLREAIISNLRQNDKSPSALQEEDDSASDFFRSNDGMDAAVYVVNERQMKLTFAGANNPLVLIRGDEVQVLKGDRMPVGIYARLNPFQSITIDIQKGDCIYTFSDGFQDQFEDGEAYNKFTASRLRDLLLKIHQQPMAEQKEILNREYEQWRGPAENQTDDVVVMGVRI